MNISEYKGIFVFAEQRDRKVQKVAYELIGKAKELAKDLNTSVTAVLLGRGMKDEAEKLCYAGADKVIYADHELLDEYKMCIRDRAYPFQKNTAAKDAII